MSFLSLPRLHPAGHNQQRPFPALLLPFQWLPVWLSCGSPSSAACPASLWGARDCPPCSALGSWSPPHAAHGGATRAHPVPDTSGAASSQHWPGTAQGHSLLGSWTLQQQEKVLVALDGEFCLEALFLSCFVCGFLLVWFGCLFFFYRGCLGFFVVLSN